MAHGVQSYGVGSLALTHFLSPLLCPSTRRKRKGERETDGVNIEAEAGENQNVVMLDQKHTEAVG